MRFFALAVAAGLLFCLLAAFTFLRFPDARMPTLTSLCLRAFAFVVVAAFAGTAGSWYYWKNSASPFSANPPVPFTLIALACAAGWVWVPAIVLLSREDSPFTAAVAILGATLLAFALRKAIPSDVALPPPAPIPDAEPNALFADTLRKHPLQFRGYILAACIYVAGYQLFTYWTLDGSGLLAICAFVFAWSLTMAPNQKPTGPTAARKQSMRAARRLALVIAAAFLVTLLALLHGVGHRIGGEGTVATGPAQSEAADDKAEAATRPSANGTSGYHSIILWPEPEKKQILPPLPQPTQLLAPGDSKPLIIRFDGQYWYFQRPNRRPGLTAIRAHGTPLVHDIQSNNFVPLIMEAHQTLGTSIPLARCREIQLAVLNHDNHPGAINIAVLLSNSSAPANELYIGQQPIASSQPGAFAVKSAPAAETLRFPVPESAKLRTFDQITVMFLPDESNYDTGPKVAIQQFQLIPR
jgi:hypothetical protein